MPTFLSELAGAPARGLLEGQTGRRPRMRARAFVRGEVTVGSVSPNPILARNLTAAVIGGQPYLFYVDHFVGRLRVLSLAVPEAPAVVATLDGLPQGVRAVDVLEGRAYVVAENLTPTNVLRIVDVSTPTAPVVIGGSGLSLPSPIWDLRVRRHGTSVRGYAIRYVDRPDPRFYVLDLTNPAAPSILGSLGGTSYPPHPTSLALSDVDPTVVFTGHEAGPPNTLRAISVADPAAPAELHTNQDFEAEPRGVVTEGGFVYAGTWFGVIGVWDYRTPSAPVERTPTALQKSQGTQPKVDVGGVGHDAQSTWKFPGRSWFLVGCGGKASLRPEESAGPVHAVAIDPEDPAASLAYRMPFKPGYPGEEVSPVVTALVGHPTLPFVYASLDPGRIRVYHVTVDRTGAEDVWDTVG